MDKQDVIRQHRLDACGRRMNKSQSDEDGFDSTSGSPEMPKSSLDQRNPSHTSKNSKPRKGTVSKNKDDTIRRWRRGQTLRCGQNKVSGITDVSNKVKDGVERLADSSVSDKQGLSELSSRCTNNTMAKTDEIESVAGSDWTLVSVPDQNCSPIGCSDDAVLLKQRLLKEKESQAREQAIEEYQKTGDIKVFQQFIAPFVQSDKKELGPWMWSQDVERWWREEKSTGLILWAPTLDSFI
ncbi:hypothetical protein B0H63DRAFT_200651 [Podospora didyma]|uniref:Uncharacterized protein n=1 Tax=Podospora didyma TaxID=330526 RepID=A0AAE0NH16_9PEZI|nr:hypothetical protein B0H63DRAFT_200651 [Podospora didyma]